VATPGTLLRKICSDAWEIIGATFEKSAPMADTSTAPFSGATAPFSENLLRSIVNLTPEQQKELVTSLATNPSFSKRGYDVGTD